MAQQVVVLLVPPAVVEVRLFERSVSLLCYNDVYSVRPVLIACHTGGAGCGGGGEFFMTLAPVICFLLLLTIWLCLLCRWVWGWWRMRRRRLDLKVCVVGIDV